MVFPIGSCPVADLTAVQRVRRKEAAKVGCATQTLTNLAPSPLGMRTGRAAQGLEPTPRNPTLVKPKTQACAPLLSCQHRATQALQASCTSCATRVRGARLPSDACFASMCRQAPPLWRCAASRSPSTRTLGCVSTDGVHLFLARVLLIRPPSRLCQIAPEQTTHPGPVMGKVCWGTMICNYKFVQTAIVLDNLLNTFYCKHDEQVNDLTPGTVCHHPSIHKCTVAV